MFQIIERLLKTCRNEVAPVGRQVSKEQLERSGRADVILEIRRSHRKFVKIGQQSLVALTTRLSWFSAHPMYRFRVPSHLFLAFVGHHPAPQARGAPYSTTKTFELYDLAMIDEEIDLRTIVLHVPSKDFRIGGLEHHLL